MTKHTPGPWRTGRPDMFNVRMDDPAAHYGKNVYVDDPRGGYDRLTGKQLPLTIAEACGIDGEEALANARLIAAAPEMYAALKAVSAIHAHEASWMQVINAEYASDSEKEDAIDAWHVERTRLDDFAGRLRRSARAKAEGREVTT